MVRKLFSFAILSSLVVGCFPPESLRALTSVSVQPSSAPAFSGTYDFDILQDVSGEGCWQFGKKDRTYAFAMGADFGAKDEPWPVAESRSAALFDALSKVTGADTILVSRSHTEGTGERLCTTVYGKAIRIKKGSERSSSAAVERVPVSTPAH